MTALCIGLYLLAGLLVGAVEYAGIVQKYGDVKEYKPTIAASAMFWPLIFVVATGAMLFKLFYKAVKFLGERILAAIQTKEDNNEQN